MVDEPLPGKAKAVAHAARLSLIGVGQALANSAQSAARSAGIGDLRKPVPFEVRVGQVLAALLLVAVVPFGMLFVEAVHGAAADILDSLGLLDVPGISIVLLLVGLGMFILLVWLCFKWVSTAGFGILSLTRSRRF